MRTIRQQARRILITLVLAVIVTALAVPLNSTSAQTGAFTSDEFTGTSLNTSRWTIENPTGTPTIGVSGGTLNINVPSGTSYTFSGSNQNAPRVMQVTDDESFTLEVKFNSGLNSYVRWKMQGVLVRDSTNAGSPKWLRFDFNTNENGLNTYVGYHSGTTFYTVSPVTETPKSNINNEPLYMRIQYEQAENRWTFAYKIGDTAIYRTAKTFTESELPGSPTFTVTHMGLFAGSTNSDGGSNPGHLMQADYYRAMGEPPPPPPLDKDTFLPFITR